MNPQNERRRRPSFVDDDDESIHLIDTFSTGSVGVETMTIDDMQISRGRPRLRATFIRALALLCVCSLSVGSHYASYFLGPLKSRLTRELGTSNTEFGLFLAALASSGTWTPLVGGIMVSRLGTATSSIVATGAVFLGQLLLLIGDLFGEVRLMTLGMFVYGLGTGPLAVVQETIIVRFFKFHGLGISLALGLVAGKFASFVSARTSYPLSQYSPSAPFFVATAATGLSFIVNLIYVAISKWLIQGSEIDSDGAEFSDNNASGRPAFDLSETRALQEVVDKRRIKLKEVTKLGDVFWAYIGLNVLCGFVWSPFMHLAPNILERRFSLSELEASNTASFLLGGSVFLYPLCGFVVDRAKRRPIVIQLLTCASVLTLLCYIWLALPPTVTKTPWPAVISFGTALGFSTLLLVVIVPQLVPLEYVSTTLGLHKSLEHAGTTIMQTLTGLGLDLNRKHSEYTTKSDEFSGNDIRLQWLLNSFVFFNILQLVWIWGLGYLDKRKKEMLDHSRQPTGDETSQEQVKSGEGGEWSHDSTSIPGPSTDIFAVSEQRVPLLSSHSDASMDERYVIQSGPRPPVSPRKITRAEMRRGRIFAWLCTGVFLFSWVLFISTSILKIRSKKDRKGGL